MKEPRPIDVMVVGSANMDLVFQSTRLPQPGETLLGVQFSAVPGGKGANQAVAIARLGGSVAFVGKIGDDDLGRQLRGSLESFNVDVAMMGITDAAPTGVAGIFVGADGQNSIVVVPGANSLLASQDVQKATDVLRPKVVLTQLEIPIEAVSACVGPALLLLNPAPYAPLPDELLAMVDVITPNESETEALTGIAPTDESKCDQAAKWLLEKGVKTVVLTLGDRGCFVSQKARCELYAAPRVEAIDTTAAGDAFNGALAFFLSKGDDVWAAAPKANRVAALSTTRLGAQTSMPTSAEYERLTR